MAQTTRSTFANIPSSSTDFVLVAGDLANLRAIKVVAVAFVTGSSATNATFNSYPTGGPGTAISCLFANGQNGGAVLSRNEDGWFSTTGGQGLSCTTGSGSTTGVIVNYVYV